MYLHCLRDSPSKKLEAESPIFPLHCPHLEEGHTENSTLPQVEQLAFLHLASFADLQEEPGLTIPLWLPICLLLQGNTGPVVAPYWGCSNYHCHWLQTDSSFLLWSCCTGQKQSCIQTALVRHWDFQQRNTGSNPAPSEAERETVTEMRWQHWAQQCTQHGDSYSVVIWVAEQTKISLQDATMNGTTLFHLPQTKESGAQES